MTQNIHTASNTAINDAFRTVTLELTQGQARRLTGILFEKQHELTQKLIRQGRPYGTQEEIIDWRDTEKAVSTLAAVREELVRAILGEEAYALIKSER